MGTKNMNVFENELSIALKQASLIAATAVIKNNPDMTLEDFYSIMRPQGATETITVGEIHEALIGGPPPMATTQRPRIIKAPDATEFTTVPFVRSASEPEINCLSNAGQDAYHASIIQYLGSRLTSASGPEIRSNCGGTKSQMNISMRKLIAQKRLVSASGNFGGKRYFLTAKGRKKASGNARIQTNVDNGPHDGWPANSAARAVDRARYRASILAFLRSNGQWCSGEDISNACGGDIDERRQIVKRLASDGYIERNGEHTVKIRYRAIQQQ